MLFAACRFALGKRTVLKQSFAQSIRTILDFGQKHLFWTPEYPKPARRSRKTAFKMLKSPSDWAKPSSEKLHLPKCIAYKPIFWAERLFRAPVLPKRRGPAKSLGKQALRTYSFAQTSRHKKQEPLLSEKKTAKQAAPVPDLTKNP